MIQPKDYLSENLSCDATNLLHHTKLCYDESVNPGFGKHRLVCVTGPHSRVFAQESVTIERQFVPFAVYRSAILGNLMVRLEAKHDREQAHVLSNFYHDASGALQEDRFSELQ